MNDPPIRQPVSREGGARTVRVRPDYGGCGGGASRGGYGGLADFKNFSFRFCAHSLASSPTLNWLLATDAPIEPGRRGASGLGLSLQLGALLIERAGDCVCPEVGHRAGIDPLPPVLLRARRGESEQFRARRTWTSAHAAYCPSASSSSSRAP